MRIYIAGKISNENYDLVIEKFAKVTRYLCFKDSGNTVINPTEIIDKKTKWLASMKICITLILSCDTLALINDWRSSKGAIMEYFIAKTLHKKIIKASPFKFKNYKKNYRNILLSYIIQAAAYLLTKKQKKNGI